jgi:membrane protein DedA with SNARE-associated domain
LFSLENHSEKRYGCKAGGRRDVTLKAFVDNYGYLAIIVGTFFEGETILVLGGFTAHQGYLALPGVIASAFVGSLSGDQLFFYLGRRYGDAILARRPSWRTRVGKATALLERFRRPYMIGFRFLYGLRTVSPFAIGLSSIPARQFLLYNAVGALLWATAVGSGGYLVGNAVELFLGDLRKYEIEALAAIAAIGLLAWVIHVLRRRR